MKFYTKLLPTLLFIYLTCFVATLNADTAYEATTTLGPVTRPLTPSAIQSICSRIYQNLTPEAIQNLDISVKTPYQCSGDSSAGTITIITYTSQ